MTADQTHSSSVNLEVGEPLSDRARQVLSAYLDDIERLQADLEHTRQIVAAQATVLRAFATLQNWRVAVLPIDPESTYRWVGGDFPWSVAQRTLDAAEKEA